MSTSHAPAESAPTHAPTKGETPARPAAQPWANENPSHRKAPAVLHPTESSGRVRAQARYAACRDGPCPCVAFACRCRCGTAG